jgi:hypothetical protein
MNAGDELAGEQPSQPLPTRHARAGGWLSAGVLLTVLFTYLAFEGRTPPYIDSRQIYDVAESIVYRHSVAIPPFTSVNYAPHPFLPSAIHLPGVVLRKAIAGDDAQLDKLVKPITSHLGSQIVAAIGCLVFLRLLLFLGLSRWGASLGTLILAFSTLVPIYARTAWSESLQTTAFIGFLSAVLRLHAEPRRKTAIWLGVWTGILVNSKYVFVLAIPGAVLLLCFQAWRSKQLRAYFLAGLWSFAGGLPFLLMTVLYNRARSQVGSATDSGYAPIQTLAVSVFRENPLWGVWSQFFSLGKSVLLYSPPLMLAALMIMRTPRGRTVYLWAVALTAAPVLAMYGKFAYWGGDWCWGPRYQLFVVPALLLLGLFSLDEALRLRRPLVLSAWALAFCVGLWVQLAGGSQYWDQFIRVSKQVQGEWLGVPNRRGAFVGELRGQCDPCFEDLYARTYTPAFQPIEAHGWFLRHHLHGDSWEKASEDMPLRRYTSLDFDIVRRWYKDPAWDYWKLAFVGRFRAAGNWMMSLFILGIAAGVAMWLRGLRGRWWLGRQPEPVAAETTAAPPESTP